MDRPTRTKFAQDVRNITLASPQVNRFQKRGKDAGEWLSDQNRCRFAGRVFEVKRAYGLTVDRREAAAPDQILRGCECTPMMCRGAPASAGGTERATGGRDDVLAGYDDNRMAGDPSRCNRPHRSTRNRVSGSVA